MKRLIVLLLGLILLLPACSLGEELDLSEMTPEQLADLQSRIQAELNSRPGDYDVIITQALAVLKDGWKEEFAKYSQPGITYYVDIRGVRVVRIKDNLEGKASEPFGNLKYLVEFLLYDDYFSSGSSLKSGHNVGYLDLSGVNCVVTVDLDDNMALTMTNPLRIYSSRTFNYDYSAIIEEVIDLHDRYNQLIEFSY